MVHRYSLFFIMYMVISIKVALVANAVVDQVLQCMGTGCTSTIEQVPAPPAGRTQQQLAMQLSSLQQLQAHKGSSRSVQ